MKTIKLDIIGMNCGHCVMAVKKELQKLELENFEVEIGQAEIKFEESKSSENQILAAVEEAGFKVA